MRQQAERHLTTPVEMLLVLMIVLHEGGRGEQFALLAERVYDRYGLGPDERESLAGELAGLKPGNGAFGLIASLRKLDEHVRRSTAKEILDFAAFDPLLSPHQRRLRIRVLDILELDEAG